VVSGGRLTAEKIGAAVSRCAGLTPLFPHEPGGRTFESCWAHQNPKEIPSLSNRSAAGLIAETNDGQSGSPRVAFGFSRKFSEIYSPTAFSCRRRSQTTVSVFRNSSSVIPPSCAPLTL